MKDVAAERLHTSSRLFAYTRWDTIPVMAEILHCAYFFAMFYLFPRVPFTGHGASRHSLFDQHLIGCINGISHNFIHNPCYAHRSLTGW